MIFRISPEVIQKLKDLESYALLNPFTLPMLKEVLASKRSPAGDIPEYSITIPVGYKVVYSIEEHPGGFARHLSVSSPSKGKHPKPIVINTIMSYLEFDGMSSSPDIYVYTENVGKGIEAINIIEMIKDVKSFNQYVKDITNRT